MDTTIKFTEGFEWVELQRETDPRFKCVKCDGFLILVPSAFATYGQCPKCGAFYVQKPFEMKGNNA